MLILCRSVQLAFFARAITCYNIRLLRDSVFLFYWFWFSGVLYLLVPYLPQITLTFTLLLYIVTKRFVPRSPLFLFLGSLLWNARSKVEARRLLCRYWLSSDELKNKTFESILKSDRARYELVLIFKRVYEVQIITRVMVWYHLRRNSISMFASSVNSLSVSCIAAMLTLPKLKFMPVTPRYRTLQRNKQFTLSLSLSLSLSLFLPLSLSQNDIG